MEQVVKSPVSTSAITAAKRSRVRPPFLRNDSSQAWKTVDSAGKDHLVYFDNLGRTVKAIANYVSGTANVEHPDLDVTVEYAYNTSGQLARLTAMNPTTGNLITRYGYGTAKTAISPKIYRKDLLVAEIYPDSDDLGLIFELRPTGGGMTCQSPTVQWGPASVRWF